MMARDPNEAHRVGAERVEVGGALSPTAPAGREIVEPQGFDHRIERLQRTGEGRRFSRGQQSSNGLDLAKPISVVAAKKDVNGGGAGIDRVPDRPLRACRRHRS